MGLEIIILSEVRESQISYDTTYMWNLKRNDRNEHIETENEQIETETD